jgi:uncharacterized membrane protein YkgB/enamine deaminase RidA (YjgF/YER057c/UK114 family)
MSTGLKNAAAEMQDSSGRLGAEKRLKELGIALPTPPEPFGTYVEAVQTGNLLFLSGMLPTEGHTAKFTGRLGEELDVQAAREAAQLSPLNVLAVARQHLGSLVKVTRVVRLGILVATAGDVRDQPQIADAASELLESVFGKEKNPCRLVYGVASLPLGTPVDWKSFSKWRRKGADDQIVRRREGQAMTYATEVSSSPTGKAALRITGVGYRVLRYGLALVIGWIGMMKFTGYEAHGIQPLVAQSPLLGWMYHFLTVRQFSDGLGVVEVGTAILIALRPWSPKASALGSAIAVLMFLTTLSFLFSTPGWEPSLGGFPALSGGVGQFLLKDLVS